MRFLIVTFLMLQMIGCEKTESEIHEKVNGISFVATRNAIDSVAIKPLAEFNANYAAIIPYSWMESLESPEVRYDEEHGWWGEKPKGVIETIRLMRAEQIQVMLKPQIWIYHGEYTGNIKLKTEEEWKLLETTYTNYIMRFVEIAAQENVPLFCIGTELDSFVKARPEYWNKLITEIKKIYDGKLTYAGNWDSYKRVSFWSELDFIGVDAYFPLSDQKTPELSQLKESWKPFKEEMSTLSRKHNKPILFTEYGYVSADYAGREPWKNAIEQYEENQKAQAVLYESLYESVWDEEWMAGGFFWKYHAEDSRWRGFAKRFTPQGKMAQEVIKKNYAGQQLHKP